jgi:hypothetical protein
LASHFLGRGGKGREGHPFMKVWLGRKRPKAKEMFERETKLHLLRHKMVSRKMIFIFYGIY